MIGALIARLRAKPLPAGAIVIQMHAGRTRVAAVAQYMAGQASSLRNAYDAAADTAAFRREAAMFQAGAAGAEAMSELLLALATEDRERFKATLVAFVNDAVDAGIVTPA